MLRLTKSSAINCFRVKNLKRSGKIRIIGTSGVYENKSGFLLIIDEIIPTRQKDAHLTHIFLLLFGNYLTRE